MKKRFYAVLLGMAVMMAMPAAAESAGTDSEAPAVEQEASGTANMTEAAGTDNAGAAEAADASVQAAGETVTTADGVLSIQLPASGWQQMADPNYWFVATNGIDVITIDHLSNGESLPSVEVAGNNYGAVYHAFVSTKNEVFVVKGSVVDQASMEDIMKAISTIKVLQFDTKTAVVKEEPVQSGEFGVRALSGIYIVSADELNVRAGYSSDETVLGQLYKDEEVQVTGVVTQGGKDYGWYQILYNGATAYVSSGFLVPKDGTAPAAAASEADIQAAASKAVTGIDGNGNVVENPASKGLAYCEYCGKWYEEGNIFRNHVCPARDAALSGQPLGRGDLVDDPASQGLAYCEYCGQWYEEGNVFRNHVCPARDAAVAAQSGEPYGQGDVVEDPASQGLAYCEYCGQWYEEGNVFRNHECPARDAALSGDYTGQAENTQTSGNEGLVYCEYCGQWYEEGDSFDNHYCPGRDGSYEDQNIANLQDPAN